MKHVRRFLLGLPTGGLVVLIVMVSSGHGPYWARVALGFVALTMLAVALLIFVYLIGEWIEEALR